MVRVSKFSAALPRLVRGLLTAALTLTLLAPTAEAGKKGRVDVLVINTSIRRDSEQAARLRTLVQIMAPGARVELWHWRRVTGPRLQTTNPRALILAPPREPWARFPKKRLAKLEEAIADWRRPTLGVGGGHQLLARANGGVIRKMELEEGEFGLVELKILKEDPLLEGVPQTFGSYAGHREELEALPEGFIQLVEGEESKLQAIRHATRPIYGIQFHPEDPRGARLPGKQIIRNFLKIAGVLR